MIAWVFLLAGLRENLSAPSPPFCDLAMTDRTYVVAELADQIFDAVAPIIDGVETGLAVSALINVATTAVMLGLGCDQLRAIKLIAAAFENETANAGPTEH